MISEIRISNLVTGVSYIFNNYDATFLIDDGSINWGEVESSHQTYHYPEQIGKFISSTVVGSRSPSIFGWIVGKGSNPTEVYDNLKLKKGMLNRFFNPLQDVEITAGGYSIVGRPDSQVKYSNTYEENNDVMCKFLISIFCPNPVFEPVIPTSIDFAKTSPKFHFPLVFKPTGIIMGLREISLIVDIVNDGINTVGAVFTLTAKATVNNPKIINTLTQEYMLINATLNQGDAVIINTNNGSRSVKAIISGVEQNYLQKLDLDSIWMQFPIGSTTLGFNTSVNGVPDDTYKNLDINVAYKTNLYNLEEE